MDRSLDLSRPLLHLDAPKGTCQLYRWAIQHTSDTTHLAWGLHGQQLWGSREQLMNFRARHLDL